MIARVLWGLLLACVSLVSVPARAGLVGEWRATYSGAGYLQGCAYTGPWFRDSTSAANDGFAALEACLSGKDTVCRPRSPGVAPVNGYQRDIAKSEWYGIPYKFTHTTNYQNNGSCGNSTVSTVTLTMPLETQQVESCAVGNELVKTFFSGWSTAPADGYLVTGTLVAPPIPYCDGSCEFGYSEAQSAEVDVQPSTNGFYASYSTHLYVGSGTACTLLTPDPSQSSPPSGGNGTGGTGTGSGDGGGSTGNGDGVGDGSTGSGDGTGDSSGSGSGDGSSCTGTACDGGDETGSGGQTGGGGAPIGGGDTGTGSDPSGSGSGTSGGTSGSGSGGTDEESSDGWLCDAFPSIFACQETGSAGDATTVANTELGVSIITPRTDIGPSESSCPSPYQMGTSVGNFELAFDGACMFADGVRPVIIGMAWFLAIGGLIGFIRR